MTVATSSHAETSDDLVAAAGPAASPWGGSAADTPGGAHERNRVLRSLTIDRHEPLARDLDSVHLRAGQVLGVVDEPMRYVYFPRDAVVAMLAVMDDGITTECATIGNEGMVGVEVFLGDGVPRAEIVVEVPGTAARLKPAVFAEAARRDCQVQATVQGYTLALINQLSHTAACNNLHSISERCARWLLMSGDRIGHDTLPITHDCLARLLGVRRASVTEALGSLQKHGMIHYQRGHIRILQRDQLEQAACEDYRLCRDAYDRLYP